MKTLGEVAWYSWLIWRLGIRILAAFALIGLTLRGI